MSLDNQLAKKNTHRLGTWVFFKIFTSSIYLVYYYLYLLSVVFNLARRFAILVLSTKGNCCAPLDLDLDGELGALLLKTTFIACAAIEPWSLPGEVTAGGFCSAEPSLRRLLPLRRLPLSKFIMLLNSTALGVGAEAGAGAGAGGGVGTPSVVGAEVVAVTALVSAGKAEAEAGAGAAGAGGGVAPPAKSSGDGAVGAGGGVAPPAKSSGDGAAGAGGGVGTSTVGVTSGLTAS
ncbi:MAG: hypothetical protein VXW87_02460 [Pseudomonadota bacterium]|nr:hypothetical protein [Pseudomonadota bacterium]